MLVALGYHVTSVTDSAEALGLMKEESVDYDMVITDMTMPNMTGIELAREIKLFNSEIPIILCTGYSELINEKKVTSLGINKYLMKPLTQKELATAIRDVFDG